MAGYEIRARQLTGYDILICGGGVAGCFAAVSAARQGAKVLLCEPMGCLGGTLTQGLVPQVLDAENKGGLVREFYRALDELGMTCPRRGSRLSPTGEKLPGAMVDVEGAKVYLDRLCADASVDVLLYTRAMGAQVENRRIARVLLAGEAGNFEVSAPLYVDATGGGALSALVGLRWETGRPDTGEIQPASMSVQVAGLSAAFDDTSDAREKSEYGEMLRGHGVCVSGTQASVVKLPSLQTWLYSVNFEYGVSPDDPFELSRATMRGRRECVETVRAHSRIPGYENIWAVSGCEHIGLREGRRVFGKYRLTLHDILAGARFEDGVCTVRFGVDIHKLHPDDTVDTSRGHKTRPYHIPYRCMLPLDMDNLFLAGRLLSGDFYAHASYRVMGDMAAVGEAVGFAAAQCAKTERLPGDLDGRDVSAFMRGEGYEL